MPSRHDSSTQAPSADCWEPHRSSPVDVPEISTSKNTRLSLGLTSPASSPERDGLLAPSAAPNLIAILGSTNDQQQTQPLKEARRNPTSLPSSTTSSSTNSTDLRHEHPPSSLSSSAKPQLSRTSSTPAGSYFAPQPGSSGLEARSPANRRPPASRSSHGIETASGPPPALSTQRSYSTDTVRKAQALTDSTSARQYQVRLGRVAGESRRRAHTPDGSSSRPHTSAGSTLESADQESTTNRRRSRSSTWSERTAMAASIDRYLGDVSDDARDRTLRALEGTRDNGYGGTNYRKGITGLDGESDGYAQAGNEDLFLNLARTTSTQEATMVESTSRSERRRSRLSLANHRLSSTSPSTRPLSHEPVSVTGQNHSSSQHYNATDERWQDRQDDHSAAQLAHTAAPSHYRSSHKARSSAASAHPLDDGGRSRYFGVPPRSSFSTPRGQLNREVSPEHDQYNGRRLSIPDTGHVYIPPRAYRNSNLSHSSTRQHYSSPLTNRNTDMDRGSTPDTPRADGTESTASTTAQSTFWDELEDMKSRLRRLELVGKLPQSSGAAVISTSNDRPRTATTTVTTISSSPKHGGGNSTSPPDSVIAGPGVANIHPLLHSTLAKCKPLVSLDVYRALEATATDALALAAMTGYNGPQGTMHSAASVLGGSSSADRQVRRKADSMCRSLTELCVALSDDKEENRASPTLNGLVAAPSLEKAPTNEVEVGTSAPALQRESSEEVTERTTRSSRVVSRLEARRASLHASNGNSVSGQREPTPESTTPTQITSEPPKPRRLSRTPTTLLRARRKEEADGDPVPRPLSRAATEIRSSRSSPRERFSKEHPSNLTPPPHQSQRSPSSHSSLQLWRNHMSTSSQVLPTANVQPGNRRYLDRSTPPATDSGSRLGEARQQRLASAGQHSVTTRERRGSVDGSVSLVGRRLRHASTTPQPQEKNEGSPR